MANNDLSIWNADDSGALYSKVLKGYAFPFQSTNSPCSFLKVRQLYHKATSVFTIRLWATRDQGTESHSSLHYQDLVILGSPLDSYLFVKCPGNWCCHNKRQDLREKQRKTFLSLCDRDSATWSLFFFPPPRRRSRLSINPLRDPVSSTHHCTVRTPLPDLSSNPLSWAQKVSHTGRPNWNKETLCFFQMLILSLPLNQEHWGQGSCLSHLLSLLLSQ